ncbi:NAD(P)-dependent oxidoreductase [Arthrobacter globiformis]|uniref:NAD(P)-dependent oxidoreductase n=1 Tax=Arthrobacter globiformis TaxID=1665 RepID=UPI0027853B51|nr:NAD(P)-dependent oxidoreductase [Arthrobacter globiformis]MDQ0864532.1 3-hydroxyisobutyrate dehydrogenase [Arthrobacter globiformis]
MTATTQPLIGFLGIGAMGLPMAQRIQSSGQRLRAVDVFPGQVSKALDLGIPASTVPDDLLDADALLVVVATGEQLLSLLESKLLSGTGAVRTVGVLSTVGVAAVREFARELADRGIGVVDCPVTGGVTGAIEGKLNIFAAGSPSDLYALKGSLEAIGTIQECGTTTGDGQAYKMVNQLLAASHLAIAGEALDFARTLGLNPEQVLNAVATGAGGSWMLTDRGPRMIQTPEQRPVQTHLSIFVKDTSLVMATAEEAGFDARILSAVAQEFKRAADAGLSTDDDSSIVDIDRRH